MTRCPVTQRNKQQNKTTKNIIPYYTLKRTLDSYYNTNLLYRIALFTWAYQDKDKKNSVKTSTREQTLTPFLTTMAFSQTFQHRLLYVDDCKSPLFSTFVPAVVVFIVIIIVIIITGQNMKANKFGLSSKLAWWCNSYSPSRVVI